MATDRLAALRAQQGGSYASNNSAGRFGSGEGGYSSRRPNPYAQEDSRGNNYEMSSYSDNQGRGAPAGNDMSAFWSEVSAVQDLLREYNDNVNQISNLHQRSLNNIDDQQASRQLDQVVASNRQLSRQLKDRIKALQAQGGDSREGQTRRQQAALLKDKFQAALQNYQQVEQKQRNATKNQMERQFRIVKPNASPEEVRAVVNDDSGGQIFQQALMNSDQYGRAKAAYREVQERHNDILKITQTVAELQQLMNDMAMMVEEQGETITAVEQTTAIAEKDVETGYKHTEEAKKSAISARKKRWICFFIVLIILIIVAVVIGVQVAQGNIGRSGGSNNNNNNQPATVTVTQPAAPSASASAGVRTA
ncbi:related to SSO1-syntaxin-related protein [Serendipita indica DSM 11827]|uniref:Related to SSO1-syntaxin-related protein n=1 Tax=Serendipita indica (strain DSM 11827) TaxID=1109443 RepID=G4TD39_SERID|nr:related to SSO1-syntaxin-related protein [Serendipita indica DSM 11827]